MNHPTTICTCAEWHWITARKWICDPECPTHSALSHYPVGDCCGTALCSHLPPYDPQALALVAARELIANFEIGTSGPYDDPSFDGATDVQIASILLPFFSKYRATSTMP